MERKCLSSRRERNWKEKMMERSEEWWLDEDERLIDARTVACRKLRGARKRGEEEGILEQLWDNYRRKTKGVKRKIRKEKKELRERTVRKFREQGGMLNWMKVAEGRIVEGEGEVLEENGKTLGRVVRMM